MVAHLAVGQTALLVARREQHREQVLAGTRIRSAGPDELVHDRVELRDGPGVAAHEGQGEPRRDVDGQHRERRREEVAHGGEGIGDAACVAVGDVRAEEGADRDIEGEPRELRARVEDAGGRPARHRGGGPFAHGRGVALEARRGEAWIEHPALPLPHVALAEQEPAAEHVGRPPGHAVLDPRALGLAEHLGDGRGMREHDRGRAEDPRVHEIGRVRDGLEQSECVACEREARAETSSSLDAQRFGAAGMVVGDGASVHHRFSSLAQKARS